MKVIDGAPPQEDLHGVDALLVLAWAFVGLGECGGRFLCSPCTGVFSGAMTNLSRGEGRLADLCESTEQLDAIAILQEKNYRDTCSLGHSLALSSMDASRLALQRANPVYFRAYINQTRFQPRFAVGLRSVGRFTLHAINPLQNRPCPQTLQTWKRDANYIRWGKSSLYIDFN